MILKVDEDCKLLDAEKSGKIFEIKVHFEPDYLELTHDIFSNAHHKNLTNVISFLEIKR